MIHRMSFLSVFLQGNLWVGRKAAQVKTFRKTTQPYRTMLNSLPICSGIKHTFDIDVRVTMCTIVLVAVRAVGQGWHHNQVSTSSRMNRSLLSGLERSFFLPVVQSTMNFVENAATGIVGGLPPSGNYRD